MKRKHPKHESATQDKVPAGTGPRKKRQKSENKNWSARGNNTNQQTNHKSTNIIAARVRQDTEFTISNDQGEKTNTELVFAFGVKAEFIELHKLDIDSFEKAIQSEYTANQGVKKFKFSPIKAVIAQSAFGTPEKAITYSGRELYSMAIGTRHSGLFILSNNIDYHHKDTAKNPAELYEKRLSDAELKDKFENTSAFQAVKATPSKKETSLTITSTQKKEVRKQITENNGHRIKGQSQVMAKTSKDAKHASATKYMQVKEFLMGLQENQEHPLSAEWLHLIAHAFLGNDSQVESNLVAGTNHANTIMLITGEALVGYLQEVYKIIEVNAAASTILKTHIGETINYRIKTKDFEMELNFDALHLHKPHITIKHVHDIIYSAFIKEKRKQADATPAVNSSPNRSNKHSSKRALFFPPRDESQKNNDNNAVADGSPNKPKSNK